MSPALAPVPAWHVYYTTGETPTWMIVLGVIALVAFGVIWIGARMKAAREKEERRRLMESGEDAGALQQEQEAVSAGAATPIMDVAAPVDASARPDTADPRLDAWAALHDPATPPARLAEIAAAHPEFAAQLAQHPNAYPALRAWAESQGVAG
jgi:flagellar biosynthesis/type III secretory pathway M-ring protein FliF/YscJ